MPGSQQSKLKGRQQGMGKGDCCKGVTCTVAQGFTSRLKIILARRMKYEHRGISGREGFSGIRLLEEASIY
jgi:hypothetical protein